MHSSPCLLPVHECTQEPLDLKTCPQRNLAEIAQAETAHPKQIIMASDCGNSPST